MSSVSAGGVVFDLLARREVIGELLGGLEPYRDDVDVTVCAVRVPGEDVLWYRARAEDFFGAELYRSFWTAYYAVSCVAVGGGICVDVYSDDDNDTGMRVTVANYGLVDICATYRGKPILREVLDDLVVDSCRSWDELLTEAAERSMSEWIRAKTTIPDLSRYGEQVSADVLWDCTADGVDRLFEELDAAVKAV